MLPLDSPRWQQLQGTNGRTQSHVLLQEFLNFLDTHPTPESLENRYGDFQVEVFEDLFHQQCTWTAATAAIPWLLKIATRLEAAFRCDLLHTCGIIILEHFPAEENQDLVPAYEEAISQALTDSIAFGVATQLEAEAQISLMIGLAGLEGELYIYYALRGHDWIEFECQQCQAEMHAILVDVPERFLVMQNDQFEYDTQRNTPVPLEGFPPAEVQFETELATVIQHGPFQAYRTLYHVAVEGDHKEFLNWMGMAFGTYKCPNCRELTRINLNYA